MSIEALETQTQHKNNYFSVKAKFKLFFRQIRLHQNVKHLVGYTPTDNFKELGLQNPSRDLLELSKIC